MQQSFFDFYQLHATSDAPAISNACDVHGSCRFCGNSFPDVRFENIAHLVPELFGRNRIHSNCECDTCNKYYQQYESDAATFVQHYLTLMGLKSKNGVPVFQSAKLPYEFASVFKLNDGRLNLNFGSNVNDFKFNDAEKSLELLFRTKKFSPFAVYKVFFKMAIGLLPEADFNANKHYLNFLHTEHPIKNGMQYWTIYRYMFKTKYHKTPKVNLYKANFTLMGDEVLPEFVLLINFSNIVFQLFLPISKRNMEEYLPENKLRLELFPAFVLDDINRLKLVDIFSFDLDIQEKISIEDFVKLYYARRDINPTKNGLPLNNR